MTVPAIALMGVPPEAPGVPDVVDPADEDVDGGSEEEDVEDVLVGAEVVEEGELALMHDASSLAPTILTSEAPPCAPRASVIMKIIEVPAATLANQLC